MLDVQGGLARSINVAAFSRPRTTQASFGTGHNDNVGAKSVGAVGAQWSLMRNCVFLEPCVRT